MTKEERTLEIIERLKKEYPDAGCTLDYEEAWKLLVSVRLAAQCTDARVNVVVPKLYEQFPDIDALAEASVEEIEEIVQDTMMWLWENRCSLMEELTLKTLLFTIVKNKALNRISHFEIRRKVHQEITEKFEKEFDNPDFYLENELFRLYENALKQLPKDYREAYEMNRNHRMTHKEIAEKLNVSPQTVNYRIGQALKLLRIALKDYLPLFILYFGLDIFKQS